MIEKFQKWVWADERRKEKLVEIYENKFACVRTRTYDGSFLTFPNMSSTVQLYPYQKNAVARILFSKNTLLAHDVGSGKTFVMIAAGMELKRMGLSKKNLFVVPNNIVGQWRKIFLDLYPTANLLCVAPKDFTPTKREEALEKIKTIEQKGCGNVPVIVAKTQYSLSDNAELLGRPEGFRVTVRDIVLKGGAGFIVAIAGKIMLMPGLGAHPAAEKIDLLSDGTIVGLS
jgi:N12 class adenine-specific DNA methylase